MLVIHLIAVVPGLLYFGRPTLQHAVARRALPPVDPIEAKESLIELQLATKLFVPIPRQKKQPTHQVVQLECHEASWQEMGIVRQLRVRKPRLGIEYDLIGQRGARTEQKSEQKSKNKASEVVVFGATVPHITPAVERILAKPEASETLPTEVPTRRILMPAKYE